MSRYITRDYRTYNTIIKDCPIILNQTRLLYDIETNSIILQIKINNISQNEIKNITFNITTYDKNDEIIDNKKEYIIEEQIKPNNKYSFKKPIIFKNKKINFINIEIKKVTYTNNKTWINNKSNKKQEINKPILIHTNSGLYDALHFYNTKFNINCFPEFNDNYWRCSCSTLNLYSSNNCNLCHASKKELKTFFDYQNIEELEKKYNQERLEKRQENLKKLRRNLFIIFKILLILILLIFISNVCFKKINYTKAKHLYNNEKYTEAIKILEEQNTNNAKTLLSKIYYDYGKNLLENKNYTKALKYLKKSNHKNKLKYIRETKYRLGLYYLNNKFYHTAISTFSDINDYKDVEDKIKETHYLIAIDYFEKENYEDAINYFKKTEDYKNSNDYIKKSNNYIKKAKENKTEVVILFPGGTSIIQNDEEADTNSENSTIGGIYTFTIGAE